MADRIREELDTILDRHDEAFRAFRQASDAFEAAVSALRIHSMPFKPPTTLKARPSTR
jgi:hypothetical protein